MVTYRTLAGRRALVDKAFRGLDEDEQVYLARYALSSAMGMGATDRVLGGKLSEFFGAGKTPSKA